MGIKISNLESIGRLIKQRVDAIKEEFQPAVDEQRQKIIERTQSGLDVNGSPFIGYSTKGKRNWKDVRQEAGLQTARVDLTYNGDMFDSFKTGVKEDGFKLSATIFFNDTKEAKKAKGHHTGQLGGVKFDARKFFGLSRSQREAIVSKLRKAK